MPKISARLEKVVVVAEIMVRIWRTRVLEAARMPFCSDRMMEFANVEFCMISVGDVIGTFVAAPITSSEVVRCAIYTWVD